MLEDIVFYAQKYTAELNSADKQRLFEAQASYHKAFTTLDKDLAVYQSNIFSPPKLFKAFLFTEELSFSSLLHKDAFLLLQGVELKSYFKTFIQRWHEGQKITGWYGLDQDYFYSIPLYMEKITLNKDFNYITHFKPFLEHALVDVGEKDQLIEKWVKLVSETEKKFLNREEVDYILKIEKKEEICIFPIVASIRHLDGLEGMPDSWILEAYSAFSGTEVGY